ncbi:CCA tRNA nucleotidyltransferase [Paenibacillus nanensis]|uniref:CCA tRNA nucleotidyltransferase n=1 Tax=Paenibacillus nanensis TaxID=393251 RepID=A0A3A1UYA4_9BACL|nr:CCA tRNA nucleotidyltransferase [Paenibacillus nanensis]RIX53519.1 CCA tRNA nucleotidyltransferase [Paenibacillus nanensis]
MKLRLTAEMRAALPIIETLQSGGYEAVFVGGAVRDAVLGLPVHDIDIATSALPEQTMSLFPKSIPTGLQHGTVTVVHQRMTYEITTYRTETEYEAYRKPKGVVFIDRLDEDLLRRDFTINAMAIRASGELYDPYGGLSDLERNILRCVGNADLRFQEDALRMVRAVRFIGAFSLKPAPSAWRSLKRHGALLRHVAMERVQAELDKMMGCKTPERSLIWLRASGLLSFLKEPISEGLLGKLRTESPRLELRGLSQLDERWASVFLAFHCKKEEAEALLLSLRFPNKRIGQIVSIMQLHDWMMASAQVALQEAWICGVLRFGQATAHSYLNIAQTLEQPSGRLTAEEAEQRHAILTNMPAKTLKELAVGGSELQRALDRKGGPWMSGMLTRLLQAVALGLLPNTKDKLLEQAKIWNEEGMNDEH